MNADAKGIQEAIDALDRDAIDVVNALSRILVLFNLQDLKICTGKRLLDLLIVTFHQELI